MILTELISILSAEFPFTWNLPPDLDKGILTTNQAFVVAKELKKNPQEISESLATEINAFLKTKKLDFMATPVGPYINIDFTEAGLHNYFYQTKVDTIKADDTNKVLVEYFAPNVGKKMHIGNIRTANIGECLRRTLSLKHNKVISNNHLGDWGIQFGLLIWGIKNIDKLGFGVFTINWNEEDSDETVRLLQKVYVKVNELAKEDENIRKECQAATRELELHFGEDPDSDLESTWKKIINVSIKSYTSAEAYLGLNVLQQESDESDNGINLTQFEGKDGLWLYNKVHRNGQFDVIIGESFYLYFMNELRYLADSSKTEYPGLDFIKREGDAIYADLEAEGLGRCYLISSDGYSIYGARDVIARFVWAGLFDTVSHISLADNRQIHTFQQSFTVIRKIIESGYYKTRTFGLLTQAQTDNALDILKNKSALTHVSFGFMTLPEGMMSARKGTVLLFETVKNLLEKEVERVLVEKTPDVKINAVFNQKVQKISVAALKWQDLSKDREQDIIFDVKQVTKFEGNTGVYQLYTLARISNILVKNETTSKLNPENAILLNEKEIQLLKKMYQLPYSINGVIDNLKPHILCNYLFEFTTMVNSWYAEHSVAREEDTDRRDALLHLCYRMKIHIAYCLSLLGIEPTESL
jgi:arginyl-tRNA synthetase